MHDYYEFWLGKSLGGDPAVVIIDLVTKTQESE
jgi:hypothetical protein